MKTLTIILTAALATALTPSCVSEKSDGSASRDSQDALIVSQMNGGQTEEVLAHMDAQVDSMRKGIAKDDALTVLSRAAYIYRRYGDYMKSMEYLNEASDSLKAQPEDSIDYRTAIQLLADRANLYTQLGMTAESLKLNSEAIALSLKNDGYAISDLYRFRAMAYQNPYQPDSVMACYDKALWVLDKYPAISDKRFLKAGIQLDRAMAFIEHHDQYPDSLDRAIQILRHNLKDVDYTYNKIERFILGRALVMKGEGRQGIALMEPYLAKERENGPGENLDWAVQLTAESYAEAGMGDKLARLFPEYKAANDSALSKARLQAVVAADFKYRTAEKEAKAAELEKINRLSNSIIAWQWIAGALLLIIALGIVRALVKRNRRLVTKRKKDMEIISNLLQHQQKLNSTIEMLNTSIDGLNDKIEGLNEEIATKEHSQVVEKVMTELKPSVLSAESEKDFRRSFTRLYPRFLRELREEFPTLTQNDELVCMLIYLKLTNEEISLSLGINRLSVNTARHRLRKKFNLDKQTDLADFLQSR